MSRVHLFQFVYDFSEFSLSDNHLYERTSFENLSSLEMGQ